MCRLPSGEFGGLKGGIFFLLATATMWLDGGEELNRRRLNGDDFEIVSLAGGVLFPSTNKGVRKRVVPVFVEEGANRCSVWLLLFAEFCRFVA